MRIKAFWDQWIMLEFEKNTREILLINCLLLVKNTSQAAFFTIVG
jgi:hypothetical protein